MEADHDQAQLQMAQAQAHAKQQLAQAQQENVAQQLAHISALRERKEPRRRPAHPLEPWLNQGLGRQPYTHQAAAGGQQAY
jgi:hypothetical protein